jgi:hypothetical protein
MSTAHSKIAHDILRYTRDNPQAADTLEGIAEWWLHNRYPLVKVRETLAELIEEGLIVELEGRDAHTVYKRSK